MRVGLDVFAADVAAWHRDQWPELAHPILPVVKVAEEAGELVGAVVKYLEGRGPFFEVLDELGDVVIAAAGAAARLEELRGSEVEIFRFGSTTPVASVRRPVLLEDLVVARWSTVSARNYRKGPSC